MRRRYPECVIPSEVDLKRELLMAQPWILPPCSFALFFARSLDRELVRGLAHRGRDLQRGLTLDTARA